MLNQTTGQKVLKPRGYCCKLTWYVTEIIISGCLTWSFLILLFFLSLGLGEKIKLILFWFVCWIFNLCDVKRPPDFNRILRRFVFLRLWGFFYMVSSLHLVFIFKINVKNAIRDLVVKFVKYSLNENVMLICKMI